MAKKIRVELELDNGKFTSRVLGVVQQLGQINQQVEVTGRAVGRLEGRFSSFGKSLSNFVLTVSLARGAIANIHAATTGWMHSIIKTNAELQRMEFLMRGLSNATTLADAQRDAKAAVDWLFEFAQNAPFAVRSLTDTFVKMKSVGIDPMKGGMQALVDAVAAFGGSQDQLHRASIAIQQMAGKGVISMEELRQQLGEAVPRAVQLMARAMGMSYGEMVERIARGQVEAQSALTRMFDEFDRVFGGRAQAMMTTWDGLVQRLQTRWTMFQKAVGDNEYFDEAQKSLAELVNFMDPQRVDQFAASFGKALASIVRWARGAVETLWEFRSTIIAVGQALLTWFVGAKVISGLAAVTARFGALREGMTLLAAEAGVAAAQMNASTFAIMKLGFQTAWAQGVFSAAVYGVRAFGVAVGALAGPIGIAMTLLWALIDVFDVFGRKQREATEAALSGQFLSTEQLKAAKEELEKLQRDIEQKQRDIAINRAAANEAGTNYWARHARELERELTDLKAKEAKLREAITLSELRHESIAIQNATDLRMEMVRRQEQEIRKEYDTTLIELEKTRARDDSNAEEIEQKRRDAVVKLYGDLTRIYENELAKQRAALKTASESEAKIIEAMIAKLYERLRTLHEQRNAGLSRLETPDFLNDKGGDKPNALEQQLARMRARAAELRAEIAGLSGTAAKFQQMAREGLFGEAPDQAMLDALVAEATLVDQLTEKLRRLNQVRSEAERATRRLADRYAEINLEAEALNRTLFDPNGASSSAGYRRLLREQEEDLAAIRATGDQAKIDAAMRQAMETRRRYLANESLAFVNSLRERTRQLQLSLMDERAAKEAEYQYEVERVQRQAALHQLTGEERKRAEQELNEYLLALAERHARDMEGPMHQLMRTWERASDRMQEAGARWLDSASEALTEFVMTGKLKFRDFAESVIRDIIRIRTQAQMAAALNPILDSMAGFVGTWLGGSAVPAPTPKATGAPTSLLPRDMTPRQGGLYHSGGIIGRDRVPGIFVDPGVFKNAIKAHGGWLAGRKLRGDEVPIIAKRDEGVFTKEQMRALGGMGNVQINVINQTGQPVTAEQNQPRFDGQQMVLDVVLKAAQRPGPFRDGLKAAMR